MEIIPYWGEPEWHWCTSACACLLAWTDYSNECIHTHSWRLSMYTVAHYSENIGIKDSDWERRRLKLIMFAAHMATFK